MSFVVRKSSYIGRFSFCFFFFFFFFFFGGGRVVLLCIYTMTAALITSTKWDIVFTQCIGTLYLLIKLLVNVEQLHISLPVDMHPNTGLTANSVDPDLVLFGLLRPGCPKYSGVNMIFFLSPKLRKAKTAPRNDRNADERDVCVP